MPRSADPAYPADYLTCTTCEADRAERCYLLLSAGPEALAPVYSDRPHSSRKTAGAGNVPDHKPPTVRRPAVPKGTVVARRASAKTESQAAAWRALAAKPKGKP
jgi:hypothetical protein